nr:GT-D fold domain-containing glycosyltransferase [Cohnella sp. REN36]
MRTPETAYEEIERALTGRTPYSLVRLGDGELLTLSQDTVIPAQAVHREGPFLPNAGLDVPDPAARDELAAVLSRASLIGVPLSRRPHFQPLLFAVAASIGLALERLPLTSSLVNYSLYEQGYLMRLLANRRVLVIGNEAVALAQALSAAGIEVTGAVQPVDGIGDVGRIVEEGMRHAFDLALVSAGIAAVPICVHLAERTGRVALDFGHAGNAMSGVPARAKPAR